MRNIDEDPYLFSTVKRHYEGEMTKEQLLWILENKGYEKEEIDSAVSDFYWIHVHTPEIIKKILLPACVLCLILLYTLIMLT